MKLTVYRQASTERADGTIVYKGEDARPYVGEGMFFVADGLGGASAIRHQKFKPELFETEGDKFADVLFKGIFNGYKDDEEFMDYLRLSFSEFHALKGNYTNVNNIKKSGYFASRIVGAILLRSLKEIEDDYTAFRKGGIFDTLAAMESEEDRRQVLNQVGEYFADLIRTNLRAVSKNANLVYEGSFSGLSLLATTLCATLYKEREDCVEALYLVAGDCKPYYWSRDGFYQMVADQEGKDGGMTNYICANEDKEFYVECTYRKFAKPCVLFNASDGCFDSAHFFSPIAFEKLLVDSIVNSEDMKGVEEKLYDFFLENGTHDDSSTIALAAFGYEDFAALKADAVARSAALDEEYGSKLEGVLTHNYTKELANGRNLVSNCEGRLPTMLMRSEGVKAYVTSAILAGGYAPFDERAAELDSRDNAAKEEMEDAKTQAMGVLDRHFIPIAAQLNLNCVTDKQIARANELSDAFDGAIEAFRVATEECGIEFDNATTFIQGELSCFDAVDKCWDYASYLSFNFDEISEMRRKIEASLDFVKTIEKRKNPLIDKMNAIVTEFYSLNRKAASLSPEGREAVFAAVLEDKVDFATVFLVEEDDVKLQAALEAYRAAKETFGEGSTAEKEAIAQELVKGYITESAQAIADGMADGTIEADPELTELLRAAKELSEGGIERLEAWASMQMEIVKPYDEEHLKYITVKEEE